DLRVGEVQTGVERGDGRVIPARDGAQKNAGQGVTVQDQLSGFHALDIQDRHDAAYHHGKLAQTVPGQLGAGKWLVGGAEIDGAGLDLRDAATGTDGLVVDAVSAFGGIGGRPLGQHRVHETGAGTGDIGGEGACAQHAAGEGDGQARLEVSAHVKSSLEVAFGLRCPL